jgi:hypothetical protein
MVDGKRRSEIRWQRSEIRWQRSEIRGQRGIAATERASHIEGGVKELTTKLGKVRMEQGVFADGG